MGLYGALYALGFLFIAFSDLGLNQYATKAIAGDQSLLRKLFPTLFSLKIFLGILYPVFMLGVGYVLGYDQQELFYLFVLCMAQAITQMIFFFRANFQAFQFFKLDAIASVLDRLILLLIILFLVYSHDIDLSTYVYAGLISVAISMIFLYFFILKLFGLILPKAEFSEITRLLKSSFPFAVITILYSVNDKVDQVMLERMAGSHENGLYVGAYRWVDAFMMYLWTVLPIFFAKFAFHLGDFSRQKRLLDFGQVVAALPMIYVSVFAWFYGEKLFFLFDQSSPAEISTMVSCLRVLFISVFINGLFAIFSTLLTSTNHEKFVSQMIMVSIVINLILNAFFIPYYGAVACAWSTGVSYLFLSLSYIVYIQYRLPFSVSFKILGQLAGVSTLLFGVFWLLEKTGLPWFVNCGIAGVFLLAFVAATRMISFGKAID